MFVLEVIFWLFFSIILYTYLGYPVVAYLLSIIIKRQHAIADIEPSVSLIISAYNEEKVIKEKLNNTLELDYPKDKLEIIVASDGSSDNTDQIVREFSSAAVNLHSYPRTGKTGIQNESVRRANGDIILFSDANAIYNKDVIRKIVQHFKDPSIGCVCGQLIYNDPKKKTKSIGEMIYWKYEKLLKIIESRLSSLIGANGSIYAVRKSDYVYIDNNLISDFVEPLALVGKGKRVIFEPQAISVETISSNYNIEFERKIRIFIRSMHGLLYMRSLLNPVRYGLFSFQFISHKLLRYIVPIFLTIDVLALVLLSSITFYYVLYLLFIVFLILSIVGKFTENNAKKNLICNISYYFILMNYASIIALYRVVRGEKIVIWKTDR